MSRTTRSPWPSGKRQTGQGQQEAEAEAEAAVEAENGGGLSCWVGAGGPYVKQHTILNTAVVPLFYCCGGITAV